MPESIIILSTDAKYVNFKTEQKKLLHGIIIGIASLFGLISFFIEVCRKNTYSTEKHFNSSHAITGNYFLYLSKK